MSALSPRSGIQVSSVYPTYTLRVSALSVCVWGGGGVWMGVCASQGTFSSFYYSNPVINIYFKCTDLKVVYRITLIVLVIGKAQFRRAMLSCDSSCCLDIIRLFN